jgi:hypothetical protein
MTMGQLVVWSAARGEWLSCPPDEIIWLDRALLSNGKDLSLHRPPRCPGLRYVHYRWELFSRDTSHWVYVSPYTPGSAVDHQSVQGTARHVLPIAPSRYETVPVRLDEGAWLVSVGNWVLPLCIDVPADRRGQPTIPLSRGEPLTQERRVRRNGLGPAEPSPPLPGAASKVRAFFKRNDMARLAMAYYYQQFILGAVAPQEVPMIDVAVALDLRAEGTVSDYKKELQRRIWNEQRHQRELAEFLLANSLLSQADLDRAIQEAAANERSGKAETARKRLRYRPKKQPGSRR